MPKVQDGSLGGGTTKVLLDGESNSYDKTRVREMSSPSSF